MTKHPVGIVCYLRFLGGWGRSACPGAGGGVGLHFGFGWLHHRQLLPQAEETAHPAAVHLGLVHLHVVSATSLAISVVWV